MKPVIVVENVFKKYSRRPDTHLSYGIRDLLKELTGRNSGGALRPDEFYAVNDLSVALNRGESLALVGRNGSGKTTLLKMLAGLIKPDGGRIMIGGRVQALINLGTGFNPKLSGRENIFNAAAMRGLTRRETVGLLDEIIAFSELEEFIDSPVETYSSGMYARLGFSVSIHLNPDILLIDEILSVGDYGFQNKCFIKMHQLKSEGVTIILVSHSHTKIVQLCDQALWMNKGQKVQQGPSKEVVKAYIAHLDEEEAVRKEEMKKISRESAKSTKAAQNNSLYGAIYDDLDNIENVHFEFLVNGIEADALNPHDRVTLRYGFDLKHPARDLNVTLTFWRKDGLHLTTISTLNGDLLADTHEGRIEGKVEIADFCFNPGDYVLVMPVHAGHSYLYRNIVKEFTVKGGRTLTWGLMDFSYRYTIPGIDRVYEHTEKIG